MNRPAKCAATNYDTIPMLVGRNVFAPSVSGHRKNKSSRTLDRAGETNPISPMAIATTRTIRFEGIA